MKNSPSVLSRRVLASVSVTLVLLGIILISPSTSARRPQEPLAVSTPVARPASATWAQVYSQLRDTSDYTLSGLVTPDGGYLIAGAYWLLKLDATGAIQWNKTYTGCQLLKVAADPQGGWMAVGFTYAPVWQACVLKVNASGDVTWSYAFAENTANWAKAIAPVADGYVVAVEASPSYYPRQITNDAWVFKLDLNGALQWSKTYGNIGGATLNAITPTLDQGVIVVGSTWAHSIAGSLEMLVFRLDSAGNLQWQQEYGGAGVSDAFDVNPSDGDAYVVAGLTADSAGVLKVDGSGNTVWERTLGTKCSSYSTPANSIIRVSDGYVVAGQACSVDGSSGFDGWIVKLDPSGNLLWQKSYGGAMDDSFKSIALTPDGGYLVVGETYSFGLQYKNAWVLKLDQNGDLSGIPNQSSCRIEHTAQAAPTVSAWLQAPVTVTPAAAPATTFPLTVITSNWTMAPYTICALSEGFSHLFPVILLGTAP